MKVTDYYAGGSYEVNQSGVVPWCTQGRQAELSILIYETVTKRYYSFAGQLVAMDCDAESCSGLTYFITDP